eukprot:TRINITY_DN18852_c0_g1_i1.p1 TRINITY_DN18852_c0_g1~~TRINITY_DN18852_c0_g1_i1.p1  ORF type:complete len:415 (-),score=51.33 TRINITY_DN18852_c0_g1_i1:207-1451(-)
MSGFRVVFSTMLLMITLSFTARRGENGISVVHNISSESRRANGDTLTISSIKCQDLPDVDKWIQIFSTNTIDPYVQVKFIDASGQQTDLRSKSTESLDDKTDPVWNNLPDMKWDRVSARATTLLLELWDREHGIDDRLVATMSHPFRQNLLDQESGKKKKGLIEKIKETFVTPKGTKTESLEVKCVNDFESACEGLSPTCTIEYSWERVLPKLVITGIEGKHFPDTDESRLLFQKGKEDTIDPRIQVVVDRDGSGPAEADLAWTEEIPNTENPKFEHFYYEFDISDSAQISFYLFDGGLAGNQEVNASEGWLSKVLRSARSAMNDMTRTDVGAVTINAKDLKKNIWRDHLVDLSGTGDEVDLKYVGQVLFEYLYVTDDTAVGSVEAAENVIQKESEQEPEQELDPEQEAPSAED